MRSPPARSRSPSSIKNSRTGNEPTTPSALTKPWVTSLPSSFWSNSHLQERNSSVTNLLDEYRGWQARIAPCKIQPVRYRRAKLECNPLWTRVTYGMCFEKGLSAQNLSLPPSDELGTKVAEIPVLETLRLVHRDDVQQVRRLTESRPPRERGGFVGSRLRFARCRRDGPCRKTRWKYLQRERRGLP